MSVRLAGLEKAAAWASLFGCCIDCLHFLDFLFPQLDEDDVDDLRESAVLDTFEANGLSPSAEVLDLPVGAIVSGK